jgi:hypothetical protein
MHLHKDHLLEQDFHQMNLAHYHSEIKLKKKTIQ